MYTLKPSYSTTDAGYFGAVDIILGTRLMNSRVIRICRKDKSAALNDAAKLARAMLALGINTPVNVNDYM